jgi:hypothetical protein
MWIDWLQWINLIVTGAMTALLVLAGYIIQQKYAQGRKEAEKKRAELVAKRKAGEGQRVYRTGEIPAGDDLHLGDLKAAFASVPISSYQKPASTSRISRFVIVLFFVITTFILVYLCLLTLEYFFRQFII